MANTYKVLGQSAPTDTNNANLYTVGAGKSVVSSSLVITNVTGSTATCRVFIRVAGAAAAASNALIYDGSIAANDFKAITIGITLAATDIITVRTGTANALTFHLFGNEIS